MSLDSIAEEVITWGQSTFPHVEAHSLAEHLRREAHELVEDSTNASEQADIFILLVQIAHRTGVDLAEAVREKLEINKRRTWKAPDAQGVVEHQEEIPDQPLSLLELFRIALREEKSEKDRQEQRISFAYGNTSISNPDITREMVEDAARRIDEEGERG